MLGGRACAVAVGSRASSLVDFYMMALAGAGGLLSTMACVARRLGLAMPLAPIIVVRFGRVGVVDKGGAAADVVSKEVQILSCTSNL